MQFDKNSLDFLRKTSQEYIKRKQAEENKQLKKENFRYWFPIILSNSFSFVAIVISVIALIIANN